MSAVQNSIEGHVAGAMAALGLSRREAIGMLRRRAVENVERNRARLEADPMDPNACADLAFAAADLALIAAWEASQ